MHRLLCTSLLVVGIATSALAQHGFRELGSQPPEEAGAAAESDRPQARPFVIMFDAHAGYGLPGGDLYDGADSGLIYGGSLRIALTPKSYLSFRMRNQRIFSDEAQVTDIDGQSLGTLEASLDVRQYLLCFGQLFEPSDGRSLGGYFEAGLGIGDNVAKASLGPLSATDHQDFKMLAVQVGGLVPLSEGGWTLDLSVSMLMKLLKESSYDEMFNAFLFSGQLGLAYGFQPPGS